MAGTDIDAEFGGTWFTRKLQPAIAGEIERYGLSVNESVRFDRAVWAGTDGRVVGRSPGDTFAPLFEPANHVMDAAVERVRQAFAAGTETAGVRRSRRRLDRAIGRPARHAGDPLSWMAAVGGGDPGEQSILMLIGDLALTGFALGASMEDVGESFAEGTAALVGALEADIRGEILRGVVVTRVERDDRGVRVSTVDGAFEADAAVVALPFNCLADVAFSPDSIRRSRARRNSATRDVPRRCSPWPKGSGQRPSASGGDIRSRRRSGPGRYPEARSSPASTAWG